MDARTIAARCRIAVTVSLLAGAFACAGAGRSAPGEAPPGGGQHADSPGAVAAGFFAAVEHERWRDAVEHLDLREFEAFRQSSLRPMPQIDPLFPSVEELMARDPEMPRAAAEYQVKEYRAFMESARSDKMGPLAEFADVPTLDSLRRLSTEDAAAAWLRARDVRWMLKKHQDSGMEECDSTSAPPPAPGDSASPWRHEVLGVARHDSVAWVLYRPGYEAEMFPKAPSPEDSTAPELIAWYRRSMPPLVLEMRRRGDRWRILPGASLLRGEGMIGSYTIACPEREPRAPGR